MTPASGMLLTLAYILGLLSTAIPWGGYGLVALGGAAAVIVPRFWRTGPKAKWWLVAGGIGLLASLYFQIRMPHPSANDISQFISNLQAGGKTQVVTVRGKIETMPRLTRSQRAQFWLQANQLSESKGQNQLNEASRPVTGRVYVTVPLLQATGLHPGRAIAVTGSLYKPRPATNPGGFNFQAYLAQEGCFAGLSGRWVQVSAKERNTQWGWWAVQQRIIRSQIRWLGSPAGPLVSSMVLGGRTVDLPYDTKDQFAKIGLAHALAASGFQTLLILSVILALTERFSERTRFWVGFSALWTFVGLTGWQPAVLRAALMGTGALAALTMKRTVKPLGLLVATGTFLLVWNPHWIWNLGFQLSFLATMGLLVTVQPLTKWLDWLPTTIAALIAVPISAYLWTLPLQLYAFGIVSPYSIPVNIITTPLISVISIGGIISALAALVWPLAGSASAWLLHYPTQVLITTVDFFSWLPGNALALGTISALVLLILYGLIGLAWLQPWWQRRKWLAGLLAIGLVAIPAWQTQTTLFGVTVLATSGVPVLVIQDGGQVTLINSGNASTADLTVLPFLQKQGINRIDQVIALNLQDKNRYGWSAILKRLPISTFYDQFAAKNTSGSIETMKAVQTRQGTYLPLLIGQVIKTSSTSFEFISAEPAVLQLQIRDQVWLGLGDWKVAKQEEPTKTEHLPSAQVLWWSGNSLSARVLAEVQPRVAISTSVRVDPETIILLEKSNIQLYWTGRDGALQWTPEDGFETALEFTDKEEAL